MPSRQVRIAALLGALAITAAACGGESLEASAPVGEWSQVRDEARGQTVRWWMFGGDARVNDYVDEIVRPRAEALGIKLVRVPVDDTVSAVQRVVAEVRAGKTSGGSVDLLWVNGENFSQGKRAGLWLEDWATNLPNARFVDWTDPTISTDFGVPIAGQEAPWSRATFVFAHDRARTADPPRSYEELLEYARNHPGRFTYPAPPDFTGSAFVRQAVQALGEDDAFTLLEGLKPHLWRGGDAFPGSEAELSQLFGNGQVDFAMSYDPSFVQSAVRKGIFSSTARPFVFDSGALQNTSYVTIPANAAHQAGALVVADLLLSPELQHIKADPGVIGLASVLDRGRLPSRDRLGFARFDDNPYTLVKFGRLLEELPASRVLEIEERWEREVLR
jgi:putative spermidine/putrescine transport system substrate-binding protein